MSLFAGVPFHLIESQAVDATVCASTLIGAYQFISHKLRGNESPPRRKTSPSKKRKRSSGGPRKPPTRRSLPG